MLSISSVIRDAASLWCSNDAALDGLCVSTPTTAPLADALEVHRRLLGLLEAELADIDEPLRPQSAARLIAARQALFSEVEAARVVQPMSWAEERVVFGNRRVHVAHVPATGAKPARFALNVLLADDELERFAPLWSSDVTAVATPDVLEQAARELDSFLARQAPLAFFASLLFAFAQDDAARQATVAACKPLDVSTDVAPLVFLNVALGQPLFAASTMPQSAFPISVPRALRLGFGTTAGLSWRSQSWFSCLVCKRVHKTSRAFVEHVRTHFERECGACGAQFDSAEATLEHCVHARSRKSRVEDDHHHVGAMLHRSVGAGVDALVVRGWRQVRMLVLPDPPAPAVSVELHFE